jgi:hypothetical protein
MVWGLLFGVERGEGAEERRKLREALLVLVEYGKAHDNLNIF